MSQDSPAAAASTATAMPSSSSSPAEYPIATPPLERSTATPLEPSPPALSTHPAPAAIDVVEKPRRLAALDVFRGITIAAMVLANNSGGSDEHTYPWLTHSAWHGWTPTDLIFPFFLFIVGVATPFSLAKRSTLATSRAALVGRIWSRALALFVIGQLIAASNLPLLNAHAPVHGFVATKALRAAGFVFIYGSILALLTPWPWRRLSTWLPVVIAVLLYGYLVAMHFVRARAIANGWPVDTFGNGAFNPDMLRIPGVLQRIGVCYGIAATAAIFVGWRSMLVGILALFAVYSGLMLYAPIRFHTVGSLTAADNFSHSVDEMLLEQHLRTPDGTTVKVLQKHTYSEYADNEGIVSTLPSIATAMIGVLVGWWLRTRRTTVEHCAGLLALAVPTTILGCVLDVTLMPINKNLWTPSFTVFTAGLAMLGLGFIFYLTDVLGRRAWAFPFRVMGMNAIAAFVASALVIRACGLILVPDAHATTSAAVVAAKPQGGEEQRVKLNTRVNHQVVGVLRDVSDRVAQATHDRVVLATPYNESLAYALTFLCVIFLITLLLWACRIFVKV